MATPLLDAPRRAGSRATLIAVLATAVTLPFGQSVTGVQLDRIGVDMGGNIADLQWVANAYNLAFAALLLVAGSLADLVGRRRVFIVATGVFLLGSLASAVAPNLLILDLCRLVAGAGAAAQLASAPALLASAFPDAGPARARAFGLLGTGFGAGLALGPVVGGLLVAGPGWRWAFLIVIPFAAVALLAARSIPESRGATPRRFDLAGAVAFALALLLIMLGLGRAADRGWSDFGSLALLAAGAVVSASWAVVERRQAQPMFDLGVLRDPGFLGASVAWWAVAFGFVALLIEVPFQLQSVSGLSAFKAGLALLPMTVPLLLVPSVAPRLAKLISPQRLVPLGVAVVAAGDLLLARTGASDGVPWLSLGLALVGIGAGSINGLLDNIAMSAIPAERAGMAAGGFQTMRVLGDAVAIAVAGSLLATLSASHTAATEAAVKVEAFHTMMLVLAGVTFIGAVLALMLLRRSSKTA